MKIIPGCKNQSCLQIVFVGLFFLLLHSAKAQDNYEIQVYESPTVPKGYTMVELHSNFTTEGSRSIINKVYPTNHEEHETVEITHGFAQNFEIGFYFFNSLGSGNRTAYVGSHIRPRFTAPHRWKLPFGLSLSTEVGYQKRQFSEDDWTLEIRPIIDRNFNKLFISLNPTVDKSLHGLNSHQGFVFSPNVLVQYSITKILSPALEYYGSVGPFRQFLPWGQQDEQLFFALNVDVSPDWEINAGYGFGLTSPADRRIIKCIIGYRIKPSKKALQTTPSVVN